MPELFISIFNMSIVVFWSFLFVLLIRILLKRAPKIYSYIIWGIVFLRAVCPYFLPLNISLFNILKLGYTDETRIVYIPPQIVNINSSLSTGNTARTYIAGEDLNIFSGIRNAFTYAAFIWLIVFAGIISYNLYIYLRFKHNLKASAEVEKNIFKCDKIKSAYVIGLFSPKIYIPADINECQREYIVLHEKIHIKRRDNFVKLICFIICAVHWFNPFIWAAFKLMNIDMEMSCDEKVINSFDTDIKKSYTQSLLDLAAYKQKSRISTIAFGESSIKTRIKNILKYKKCPFIITVICTILIILSAVLLLTNPKSIASRAVSIIGGADGPTSVFIAGKVKDSDNKEEQIEADDIVSDLYSEVQEGEENIFKGEFEYPIRLTIYEEESYSIIIRFKNGQDINNITSVSEYELVKIDSNTKKEIVLDGCLTLATLNNPIILAEDRLIYTAAKDSLELSKKEPSLVSIKRDGTGRAIYDAMYNFVNHLTYDFTTKKLYFEGYKNDNKFPRPIISLNADLSDEKHVLDIEGSMITVKNGNLYYLSNDGIKSAIYKTVLSSKETLVYDKIGLSANEWVCTGVGELGNNDGNVNTLLWFANLNDNENVQQIYTNLE